MIDIDWRAELASLEESLPQRLEALANVAETADYWTDEHRLMPAEGVADLIYEVLDEILRHRRADK